MTRKIGAHVSAAGGTEKAVKRAHDIGATCVQLFSGSPRSWARKPVAELETEKVFSEQEKYDVSPIFIHSIYLINLTADKPELLQKSRAAVEYDLQFCSAIKGAGIVVHLGSHQGRGWEVVRDDLAQLLREILAATPADSKLLIENSAGQQGKLCSNLGEIRWLLDAVNSPRLGWCFDTCHGWAAGYYLGEQPHENNGAKTHLEARSLVAEIEQCDLWEALKCVHVNDSRDPFASGRDRHDNLGEGSIPQEDLHSFLAQPQLATVPLVIEVPGIKGEGPDRENIQRLQALL